MRALFHSCTITGRGMAEWQYLIETLPADIGKRLKEIFRPKEDEAGGNYIIMNEYGYHWSYTYARDCLTVIIKPDSSAHPGGCAYKDDLAQLLNQRYMSTLLVIQH